MNQQPGAQNSEEFDYHILRQESYVHHRMRSECFEKAQEAYRRGMREVAIFYSQEVNVQFIFLTFCIVFS